MKPAAALVIGATAIGAALLLTRQVANAAAAESAASDEGDGSTPFDAANPWGFIERGFDTYQTEKAMHSRNVQAFLSLIAYAEGTARGADPYRVCFGYNHTIKSFADHPAVTGEWKGERLADAICRGANMNPGCVSTAAGRYQIIRPTWLHCKRSLGLLDFSPASQDAAAVFLIRRRGALDEIEAGRIDEAVQICREEWASLPGAGYGQPERQLAELLGAYSNAGGVLA